jgi:hypothetical protein
VDLSATPFLLKGINKFGYLKFFSYLCIGQRELDIESILLPLRDE